MAKKLPWFAWYADDWLSDEKLRTCSPGARGLWVDMLSLMHKNDRRGYLQINGKPVTSQQLARMTGCSADEVSPLLAELVDAGVPSVTEDGILYSRKMVRDESKRQLCSAAGKKGGGNPQLSTFKGDSKGGSKGHPKGVPKGVSGCVCVGSNSSEEDFSPSTHNGVEGGAGGEGATFKGQNSFKGADFDRFWAAYPRKTAKAKAREVWKRLRPDEAKLGVILAALERQKQCDQWQRGIIPHASTWLNQERWEDEIATQGLLPLGESTAERLQRTQREMEERRRKYNEGAMDGEAIKERLRQAGRGKLP